MSFRLSSLVHLLVEERATVRFTEEDGEGAVLYVITGRGEDEIHKVDLPKGDGYPDEWLWEVGRRLTDLHRDLSDG